MNGETREVGSEGEKRKGKREWKSDGGSEKRKERDN